MKIDDVLLTLSAWDDIPATRYGSHTGKFSGRSQLGLLTLKTDEGVEGHAFLGAASRSATIDAQSLIDYLKPMVMGQDPMAHESLYKGLHSRLRATTLRAIGAVDVALWDIAGKVAGMPIYKMLGAYRDSLPAYASSPTLESPEEYVEQALEFQAANWGAYKIHPPTQWKTDIKVCQAVREAVGDDYTLMLDSTWSYRYPEAVKVGRAIEELDYYWYEDPLAEEDIYNYVKLPDPRHPYSRHGIFARWVRGLCAVDHAARDGLSAWRCCGKRGTDALHQGGAYGRRLWHEF